MIVNAKTRRVSICSALDTLLVHKSSLEQVVGPLAERLAATEPPMEVRADERAHPFFARVVPKERLKPLVAERDFGTEFLDYILAVATVD